MDELGSPVGGAARRESEAAALAVVAPVVCARRRSSAGCRLPRPLAAIRAWLPVVEPDSRLRMYWDALVFVAIFYSCNVTPILVATPPRQRSVLSKLRLVDFAIDVLFALDTCTGFLFGHVDEDSKEIVLNHKVIHDTYLASARFKINLLAMSPLLSLPNGRWRGVCKLALPGDGTKSRRIARLSCLKVARMTRSSRILMCNAQLIAVKHMLARGGVADLNEPQFRMCKIGVYLIMCFTTFGSMYFYIACNDADPQLRPFCVYGDSKHAQRDKWINGTLVTGRFRTSSTPRNWVANDAVFLEHRHAWTSVVARMIYFMVQTFFTIGYGDSVSPASETEIRFTLFLMITGAFTYASMVANMTSIFANANVLEGRHLDDVSKINSLIKNRDLPDGLRSRISGVQEYLYSKQYGMLDATISGEMPPKLRELVAEEQIRMLLQVPFFAPRHRGHSDECARKMALALDTRVFQPDSTVIYAHEKHRELLVVRVGTLLVFSIKSPAPLAELVSGDYVGDFQLVLDVKHPVAIKTSDAFTEVFVLTYPAFKRVLDELHIKVEEKDRGVQAMIEAYRLRLRCWRGAHAMLAGADADGEAKAESLAALAQAAAAGDGWKIAPDARFHAFWEPVLFLAVMSQLVNTPIRMMRYATEDTPFSSTKQCLRSDDSLLTDLAIDAVFWVEIVLRATTLSYHDIVNRQTTRVNDSSAIWRNYRASCRFKVDCFAAFPWLSLAPALIAAGAKPQMGCMWFAALRFPHLARFLNLSVYLGDVRAYLAAAHDTQLSETFVTVAKRAYETVTLLVNMACFWGVIHGLGGGGDLFRNDFARAFYFAIVTFTTVGYGDIVPTSVSETWFIIFSAMCGATFFAGVVANITGFVHSVDVSEDNISHKKAVLSCFMSERELSEDLVAKVMAYFDFVEAAKGGLDELKLLRKYMPTNLRDDVVLYMTHRLILSCKVFRGAEAGFLRAVMLELRQRFYVAHEVVVHQNRPADGMSFVAAGTVAIIVDGDKLATLAPNGFFAEEAILRPVSQMPYSARCLTYNEQWYLARHTFRGLLPSFPTVAAKHADMERRVRKYRPKRDPTRDAGWEVLRRLSSTALATAVTLAQVAERMPRGVLHPEGAFMRAWAFVLLFFNVWNAFFVPLKICFCAGYSLDGAMAALAAVDYCGDAVFLADVVLCARHVAYHDGEQLVKNPQKIFRRYRRSWRCPAQIFASLPLDVVYFAYPAARHAFNLGRIQYLGLFRLNRLARLFYIGDHFERCERASARWGLKLPKNGTRMARLILAMLAASHVFGSIFFFIADSRGRALGCPEYADPASGKSCKNWAQGKNLLNVRWREIKFDNALHLQNVSSTVFPAWGTKYSKARLPSLGCNGLLWRQYVTSLYWGTATITTVGYGDVSAGSVAESKFSIICLFVSVSLYTLIIANLEDIVSQLDVTLTLNAIQRERVQRYCVRSYLPDSVQRSINDYYDKLWAVQKGVSGTSLLNMLPHNLRAAVVGELAGSMVSGLFFVRDQGAAFVDDLACILDLDLYMPQDFLFRAGECAWNIFLVFFGSVQLLDEASRQVYSVLGRAALGEAEFFGRVLYPLSAEVIDHSQVFALRFSNFEQLLAKWGLVEACRSATIRDYADLQVLALEKLKDTMIPNLRHAKIQRAFAHVIREANPLTERFLVDPNSILKRSWLLLCLAGALYFVISVPFEIAFSRHYKPTIFAGDVFFMAVYVSDIYLNLTRFMVKKQGKLVEDPEHFRELYVRADLANDVLGIFPVSLIAVLAQAGPWGQRFGKQHYSPLFNILRLFQVLRARQLNLYFRSCLAFLGEYCGVQVKGDMVFLVILFCGILTVCHWLASALYTLGRYELYAASGQWGWFTDDSAGCEAYLARRTSSNVWICADSNIYRGRASTRWLYSYYWALYTCSTIGYGAVSIKSNAEKVLCIAAMVVGAICCDAGIVACLTSYFEHRDHQAGTNSRRLNCCAKMLGAAGVPRPLQGRVADFFAYMDDELGNLDEGAVLAELNTALRNAILHRAALTKLCDSLMYGGFEAGIVATMVSEMRTVVCVPLERILQIGQPDPSLFIFQQGVAHSVDGCGDEEPIATGTILSNVEFKQVAKRVGVPTKSLDITVVAARGLPHQVGLARSLVTGAALCNPYVEVVIVSKTVFGSSLKTCSTKVRKHTAAPVFDETFRVKAYQNTEHATVSAYHWRRGLAGKKLGACLVAVKDSANARPRWHALCDDGGRKCGEVRLSCRFDALGRGEIAATAELTVIADSFCHLYKLDFRAQEVVRHYIKGMRLPIAKRLSALHDGAVPFRPSEADLEVMCDGDDEMSLCTHVAGSRGFEAQRRTNARPSPPPSTWPGRRGSPTAPSQPSEPLKLCR